MEYKNEQTKVILRRRNSIQAFKVLDIQGDNLIIRNPYNRKHTVKVFVPKIVGDYKAGDYADIKFLRTGSTGYTVEVVGHTPPEFMPDNEADIV